MAKEYIMVLYGDRMENEDKTSHSYRTNLPHNSPYAFSENRVIDAVELEGLEMVLVHGTWAARKDTEQITL